MASFYIPILILQALCAFHAYKNQAEQKWYWIIILIPVVGCVLYIFNHFSSDPNLEAVTDAMKGTTGNSQRIAQFEREVQHSDNVSNKINLADAYMAVDRYDEAIKLYQECSVGFMIDDPVVRMKLIQAYYLKGDFKSVLYYGKMLEKEKTFQQAEERIAYAWANFHTGNEKMAEEVFHSMDRSFTNYNHRLEYCRFLNTTNHPEKMKRKLKEILA